MSGAQNLSLTVSVSEPLEKSWLSNLSGESSKTSMNTAQLTCLDSAGPDMTSPSDTGCPRFRLRSAPYNTIDLLLTEHSLAPSTDHSGIQSRTFLS